MCKETLIFVTAVAALVNCFGHSNGELEAKLASGKLPIALVHITPVYDGNDSVYLFGGHYTSGDRADILRYSVSLDKVEKVSSLSEATFGGLALESSDGKFIYYFGGWYHPRFVQKFNTQTNITVLLPTALPANVLYADGVSMNGTHFIFCGRERTILQFNEKTETADITGDLPFENSFNVISSTIIPNGQQGVWLFGASYPRATNPILEYNTTSKTVSIPTGNFISLATLNGIPASVWDGRNGYIIGALGRARESDGSVHPTNGFLKVNLEDASTEFIPILNYPVANGTILDLTSAVYVEKLNRIYIFGGHTDSLDPWKYNDSIWYIDLISPPSLD